MTDSELIKEILIELKNLKSEISTIKLQIDSITKSTNNMDNHISFVESVWSVVKNPFSHALQLYYGDHKSTQKLECLNIKNITN
jgi:hypothetical protein